MARILDVKINEIRQKAKIEEVISHYIPITKVGNNYKALCPFHNDHDPSLSISADKQIFKCFVCETGGNVFDFVKEYEKIDFVSAVVKVGQLVGVDVDEIQTHHAPSKSPSEIQALKVMEQTQLLYQYLLKQTKNELVLDFLQKRKLSEDICEHFKIGYCDPNTLTSSFLINKGFSEKDCIDNNVSVLSKNQLLNVFNNRITFAICDQDGNPIAYTARALVASDSKYINSSTTDIYQKSHVLYNYHHAKLIKLKDKPLILCEGVMDVIAFYKAGYEKCIATLGTALSDYQIKLLKKLNCPIVLAYDGDKAGQSAAFKIGSQLIKNQFKISVYHNQTEFDPDEILSQKDGVSTLQAMIEKPLNWYQFCLNYATLLYGSNSYDDKKNIVSFYLPLIQTADALDKSYYLSQLSRTTGFDQQTLSNQFKPDEKINVPSHRTAKPRLKSFHLIEKNILAHMISGKKFDELYFIHLGFMLNEQATQLALLIHQLYLDKSEITTIDLLDLPLSDIQKNVCIELSTNDYFKIEMSENSFLENVRKLKMIDVQQRLNYLKEEIASGNNSQEILQQFTLLNVELNKIQKGE